jgi:hypothetical protein
MALFCVVLLNENDVVLEVANAFPSYAALSEDRITVAVLVKNVDRKVFGHGVTSMNVKRKA